MKKFLPTVSTSALALCLMLQVAYGMDDEDDNPNFAFTALQKRKAANNDNEVRPNKQLKTSEQQPKTIELVVVGFTQNSPHPKTLSSLVLIPDPCFSRNLLPNMYSGEIIGFIVDSESRKNLSEKKFQDRKILETYENYLNQSVQDNRWHRKPSFFSRFTLSQEGIFKSIYGGCLGNHFPNLTRLTLWDQTEISDVVLKQFPNLESLKLNGNCDTTGEILLQFTNLKKLSLPDNTKITDKTLKMLTKLKTLELFDTTKITDESVSHLTNLTKLCLASETITSSCLRHLIILQKIMIFDNVAKVLGLQNFKKLRIDAGGKTVTETIDTLLDLIKTGELITSNDIKNKVLTLERNYHRIILKGAETAIFIIVNEHQQDDVFIKTVEEKIYAACKEPIKGVYNRLYLAIEDFIPRVVITEDFVVTSDLEPIALQLFNLYYGEGKKLKFF